MDSFERIFPIVCFCFGIVLFLLGMWHIIGGMEGLHVAWMHVKDWWK